MNTSNDVLNDIRDHLDQLLALVTSQQKDINKIQKWIAKQHNKQRPVSYSAVVTSPAHTYEYGEVKIQIDLGTWTNIKKGQLVTIQGQGWRLDGMDDDDVIQDHWTFNQTGRASVTIKMEVEDEHEWWDIAFSGDISECDIVETEAKP